MRRPLLSPRRAKSARPAIKIGVGAFGGQDVGPYPLGSHVDVTITVVNESAESTAIGAYVYLQVVDSEQMGIWIDDQLGVKAGDPHDIAPGGSYEWTFGIDIQSDAAPGTGEWGVLASADNADNVTDTGGFTIIAPLDVSFVSLSWD